MDNPEMTSALRAIIRHHLTQYPGLGVADLYKLVFQAAMGSEHAVVDPEQAKRRLRSEAETMTPVPDGGPMIDPVSPDHRLVRVNLRPFLAHDGDLDNLAQAFIQTSVTFTPSIKTLSTFWRWAEAMATGEKFPFQATQLTSYGDKQRMRNYPAVHHSSPYRQLHQPSYRVVLVDLIALPAL